MGLVGTGNERVIEEDLLCLAIRNPVLFPVLSFVSAVPVESDALLKVVINTHGPCI
jgi:hypothetical protein